jgi:uncharacterized protein
MLVNFFFLLRQAGVPVTVSEFLSLLEALKAGLGESRLDRFYYLARTCLVKNERHYDRFDRVFSTHLKDVEQLFASPPREWPADWLDQIAKIYPLDWEKSEESFFEVLDGPSRAYLQRAIFRRA